MKKYRLFPLAKYRILVLFVILLFPFKHWAQNFSVSMINNGNMEGNDVRNFFVKIHAEDVVPATITDGVGVNESRGVKVEATAKEAEVWDNQFWIRLKQPVSDGTRFRISYDYRADKEALVRTEAHEEPGTYINMTYHGGSNDDRRYFTTEWQHFSYEGTMSSMNSSDQHPMLSVAFTLNHFNDANTYYFDNIVFEVYLDDQCPKPTFKQTDNIVTIQSPFDATIYYTLDGTTPTTNSSVYTSPLVLKQNCTVKAIAVVSGYEVSSVATYQYIDLVNLVNNSSLEGSDVSSFFFRTGAGEVGQAVITDGVGFYDDNHCISRGIKVEATAKESEIWENQFWIRLNQPVSSGTKYRISFNYRADKDADVLLEGHAEPGEYISGNWLSVNFRPMWGSFSEDGTVSSSQSTDDKPLRSIAFDLSTFSKANNYYFDDIKFEVYLDNQCPKPTFTTNDNELNIYSPFNATIYYTLDGTTPTTSSSVYTSPLVLNRNYTVKAIAVVDGYKASPVATYNLSLLFPDCPPGEIRDAAIYLYHKGIVEGEEGLLLAEREAVRAEAAKTSLYGAYFGPENVPTELNVDNYPSVYSDLQDKGAYYFRPAKALLYLEYGDGVAPFDRNRLAFEPTEHISRLHVLKVLLEAFNIKPDLEGTDNPFPNDEKVTALANSNPMMMGYIRKAANLGIITKANETFRPNDNCTRGELFLMLARIMQKIEAKEIDNPNPQESDYFQPLNTTLATIGLGIGLQMGNFQHYTKTSFAISGVMPLAFAHTYNSYNTTLPSVFFGDKGNNDKDESYQPLGDGWSHNYHSFITVVGDYEKGVEDNGLRVIVHWGGGNIDVYKSNGSQLVPESMGVYDEVSLNDGIVTIKTKSQMEYRFSKLGSIGAVVLYLYSIKDRNGNELAINYEDGQNGSKRISSVSDGQRSLKFSYVSGTDLLSEVKDPLNRRISFDYFDNLQTGKKQLQSFTDAEGNTTTYEYADLSKAGTSKLLRRIQLPKGNYIENEYDANMRLSKTENGANDIPITQTCISVNTKYGSSITTESQVDVTRGSNTSSYKYIFNENNVVTSMTGAEGLYVNSTYGNTDHPELPTGIKNNSTNVSNITYDNKGNVTSITVTGSGTLTTKMTYDDMNNLISVTDPKENEITYTYDSKGNLTGISAPEGVTASITVDSKGLIKETMNAMGVKTEYQYNEYGNLIKTTLPALGLSSSAEYDAASRLSSVIDALGRKSSFVYNNNDFLTKETNAKNYVTSYTYDENDNLTGITNAKGGVTTMSYDNATDWLLSVEFAGAKKQYDYNKDGSISTYTKPDGTSLSYSYDELGRVTSDGVNNYTYDSKLRLSSISGGGKTLTLSYDSFNRIVGTECDNHSNSYTYDKNGNCISINNTTYNYDGLNRLTSVKFSNKTIYYTYRKDSQLSEVSYPNGMTTTFGYDEVGRLTSKTTKLSNGTVVAGYSYVLNKVGNITEQTTQEPYSDIILPDESTNYTYNNGNRITKAGDISFDFDENGNTTKRGSEQYQWDEHDCLTRAGSTSLTYDPLGLIASYGDITFTTDPLGIGNVLSDSKSGAEYIYGNGLEARVKDGHVSYYVTDVRGSVVAIVDDNGNITHKYQYDDFGNVVQKEEADYNPFQYVGKYGVMYLNDHQYYMRARHYDPTIGRFLSEDPIWSTNLYPYVENNPIMGIDPEGEYIEITYGKITGYLHENGTGREIITFTNKNGDTSYITLTWNYNPNELSGDYRKIYDDIMFIKDNNFKSDGEYIYDSKGVRIKNPCWNDVMSRKIKNSLKNNAKGESSVKSNNVIDDRFVYIPPKIENNKCDSKKLKEIYNGEEYYCDPWKE